MSFDVVPRPPADRRPSVAAPHAVRGCRIVPARPDRRRKALALRLKQPRAQLLTNKLDVSVVTACGPVACAADGDGHDLDRRAHAGAWKLAPTRRTSPPAAASACASQSTKALRRAARTAQRRYPKRKLSVLVTVRVRAARRQGRAAASAGADPPWAARRSELGGREPATRRSAGNMAADGVVGGMSLRRAAHVRALPFRGDAMLLTHGRAGTERLLAAALLLDAVLGGHARRSPGRAHLVAAAELAAAPPLLADLRARVLDAPPASPRAWIDRAARVRPRTRRDRADRRRRRRAPGPPLPAPVHALGRRPRRSGRRARRLLDPIRRPPSPPPCGPAKASARFACRRRSTPCRLRSERSWGVCRPTHPAPRATTPSLRTLMPFIAQPSGNSPPTTCGRESLLQSGAASQLDRGRVP